MNSNLSALLKSYNELPEIHRQVIEMLTIKFSDIAGYDVFTYLQKNISLSIKEFQNAIKDLTKKNLVKADGSNYQVSRELLLELFPRLIQQPKYIKIVKDEQRDLKSYSWYAPVTQHVRDFLFAHFVEENTHTQNAEKRLIEEPMKAFFPFQMMLANPAYDKALIQSPLLFYRLIQLIHNNTTNNLRNYDLITQFYARNESFNGLYTRLLKIRRATAPITSGKYVLLRSIGWLPRTRLKRRSCSFTPPSAIWPTACSMARTKVPAYRLSTC